jgi:hypothetical protein
MGTPFEHPFEHPSNTLRTPLRTPFEHPFEHPFERPSNGFERSCRTHPPYTPRVGSKRSNPHPGGAGAGSNPSILNTGKGKRRSGTPSLNLSLPGVKNSRCGIRGGRP